VRGEAGGGAALHMQSHSQETQAVTALSLLEQGPELVRAQAPDCQE
jgi:hypothetical protein